MGVILPGFRFLGETGWMRFLGKSQGGAGGFNPLSLSPVLWLDFSDLTTLFQNSNGTTPVASDGDVIGYAADKSGNGNNATQGTTLNKPLYKTGIQNGLGAGLWDNSNDFLSANGLGAAVSGEDTPLTVFIVLKSTSVGVDRILFMDNSGDADSRIEILFGSGPVYQYTRRGDAGGSLLNASGGTPDTSPHIFELLFPGTTSSALVDNSAIWTATAQDAASVTINRVSIGATSTGSSPFSGYFGEILVFTSLLSDANRDLTRTYLNDKWGVF